ncbi:MAG: hypothetical protein M1477_04115 [Candidatus Thermoplasmatota archaeon]|nr:hypothetical protein [Candidatus Thermoplasmatota archaeon]
MPTALRSSAPNATRGLIIICLMMGNNSPLGKRGNMTFHLWMIGIIVPSITVLVLVYLWTKEMRNSVRKAS